MNSQALLPKLRRRFARSVRQAVCRNLVTLVAMLLILIPVGSQPSKEGKRLAAGKWKLAVSAEPGILVSLDAEKAPVGEIVLEIGKRLDVRMTVSGKLRNELVSTSFTDSSLELALKELAPHVVIDYISEGPRHQSHPIAAYLIAAGEPYPELNASIETGVTTELLEGNTEAVADSTARPPGDGDSSLLQISVKHGLLTVKARRQPLPLIMAKVAAALGIVFEMRTDRIESVDLLVTGATPQEFVAVLPDGIQFYYRTELDSFRSIPLRLVMVGPGAKE